MKLLSAGARLLAAGLWCRGVPLVTRGASHLSGHGASGGASDAVLCPGVRGPAGEQARPWEEGLGGRLGDSSQSWRCGLWPCGHFANKLRGLGVPGVTNMEGEGTRPWCSSAVMGLAQSCWCPASGSRNLAILNGHHQGVVFEPPRSPLSLGGLEGTPGCLPRGLQFSTPQAGGAGSRRCWNLPKFGSHHLPKHRASEPFLLTSSK